MSDFVMACVGSGAMIGGVLLAWWIIVRASEGR